MQPVKDLDNINQSVVDVLMKMKDVMNRLEIIERKNLEYERESANLKEQLKMKELEMKKQREEFNIFKQEYLKHAHHLCCNISTGHPVAHKTHPH